MLSRTPPAAAPPPLMPDVSPDQPARDRRAFAWAFGICAAFPLACAALLTISTSPESASVRYGVYAFALSPIVWGLVLTAGFVGRARGAKTRGREILLGALAGAAVGALLFVEMALLNRMS